MQVRHRLFEYLSSCITENRLELFHKVVDQRTRHITVVLEDIVDPNDANAVLRSCECFGVQDLHIISRRTDFSLTRGVSVGAGKWVDLYRHTTGDQGQPGCLVQLKKAGYAIGVITPDGGPIGDVNLENPLALCFGSDDLGPSDRLLEMADYQLRIPTVGFTNTFNVSVKAALCLSSIRRRLETSEIPWSLTDEARLNLLLEWLSKMPKRIQSLTKRFLDENNLTAKDLRAAGVPDRALQLML